MVQHVQLAAMLTETVGALILARSLAFEDVEQYIRGEGTPKWGFDTHADVARARAGAEAFGGLALVAAGLGGQAGAALGGGEPSGGWVVVPYAAGLGRRAGGLVLADTDPAPAPVAHDHPVSDRPRWR